MAEKSKLIRFKPKKPDMTEPIDITIDSHQGKVLPINPKQAALDDLSQEFAERMIPDDLDESATVVSFKIPGIEDLAELLDRVMEINARDHRKKPHK